MTFNGSTYKFNKYLGKKEEEINNKVMFDNNFYFIFSKTCFWEYKEKTIFLYFWNKKTCLVSWNLKKKRKEGFFEEKIENTKICCY